MIAEEFKDLNELKQAVSDLKINVSGIVDSVGELTNNVKGLISNKDTIAPNGQNLNADLNGDGKVSSIELMVVKTLQGLAEKTQRNNILMVSIILGFLLLSAILGALGIPLSF